MVKQRTTILILSAIGMFATFLPWLNTIQPLVQFQ